MELSVTDILRAKGPSALVECMPVIYQELRRQASSYMRNERAGHPLQTTALVHEAYLRLIADEGRSWQNRAHFMAVCAHLMRQILVDHARQRDSAKNGAGRAAVSIDFNRLAIPGPDEDVVALDDALRRLERLHSRQARVVELHYFTGLSFEEIAEVLEISVRTAKRDWTVARAWLYGQLSAK